MHLRHMSNQHSRKTLFDLPVEIIEEIYMLALSSAFPQTCKRIYSTVKSFSPFAHAYYILGRHPLIAYKKFSFSEPAIDVSFTLSSALRYPITNSAVVKALYRVILHSNSKFRKTPPVELPKRLFRPLDEPNATRDANSDPIPLLRVLWEEHRTNFDFPQLNAGSYGGYPLQRAVHAEFIPLVEFLLDHGASPAQGYLPITTAIGKRDLKLVKMLLEYEDKPETGTKVRWGSRFSWNGSNPLLDTAANCGARDILKYLIEEQGCVPPAKTLKSSSIRLPSYRY